MEIIKMQTSSFWKGEVGVKGLVKDQAHVYNVSLYLGNGQVRDYTCSCESGNSYKGMCAHGKALFAHYKDYAQKASQPPVHTSQEVHSMIREYTNRQVAGIMAEEEQEQAELVPVLLLSGGQVKVEFKVGRDRYYLIKDLTAFARAVREGSYMEYGKSLGFHHCESAFTARSRGLLALVLELAEFLRPQREVELNTIQRDRFFDLVMDRELEVQLQGGYRARLLVCRRDPRLSVTVTPYGRDGMRVSFDGIAGETGAEESENGTPPGSAERITAGFSGERHLYMVREKELNQCGREYSTGIQPFLELIGRESAGTVLVAEKDIPLFYARVLKSIEPYSVIRSQGIDLKSYEPQPLRAQFKFDSRGGSQVLMEPVLSYGDYNFHPVEDENLPRSVCRDIPGEFRVSQLINRYFKYKEPDGIHLVIRDDEEAVYRLLWRASGSLAAWGKCWCRRS